MVPQNFCRGFFELHEEGIFSGINHGFLQNPLCNVGQIGIQLGSDLEWQHEVGTKRKGRSYYAF